MKASITFLALSVCAMSQAITIATFADPASGPNQPMFRYNATNATLRADWLANGLTLIHPGFIGGGSSANVKMRMNPINLTPIVPGSIFSTTGGAVNFWTTNEANPIFTITFGSGLFAFPNSFGGSDFQLNNVSLSGPNVPANLAGEQFAFSFANLTPTQSGNGYTMTAAMTSSAVPEPAAIAVLASGAAMALRRRKSR